jgi:hypothetical protein
VFFYRGAIDSEKWKFGEESMLFIKKINVR